MRRTMLTGALLVGGLLGLPAAGAQAATQCTGLLTDQTINGPLQVPPNSVCALMGVRVNGSVSIGKGAAFALGYRNAPRGNTITGAINGTDIQSFDTDVPGSTVDGAIDLKGVTTVPYLSLLSTLGLPDLDTDGANFFTALDVHGATDITGSLAGARWDDDTGYPSDFAGGFSYTGNAAYLSLVNGSTIGSAMTVKGNTGGGELGRLAGLKIGGSLSCGNAPAFSVYAVQVTGHDGATSATGGLC
ncbi:MAG TPA: hypothetical protein VHW26_11005 [Solirubrobacteraceae bacterium]|nr:hypothetical protein [Solirubrobacteraceae bacterium]